MKLDINVDLYEVFNPAGDRVLYSPSGIRYPKGVEKSLLDSGYTIKVGGKPIKAPGK